MPKSLEKEGIDVMCLVNEIVNKNVVNKGKTFFGCKLTLHCFNKLVKKYKDAYLEKSVCQ